MSAREDLKLARRAILRSANPKLARPGKELSSLNAAAKNMRAELKAAFPGVKFSVRSRSFSGGNAIDVSWQDGPNTNQVNALIGKYSAGSFNGMDDSYNYSDSDWPECFGSAKYINAARRYSDEAVNAAIRRVFAKFPGNLAGKPVPSADDWNNNRLWNIDVLGSGYHESSLQGLISEAVYKHTTFAKPVAALAVWPDFDAEEVAA